MGLDLVERRPTHFPPQGKPWGTVLVANAMAVRQGFYAAYARFLAANGLHVTTFDYSIPHTDITVDHWIGDIAAMLVEARNPAPHLPLLYVGHSLGGQLIGMTPGNEAVRASLHITAGSGYYKFNDRMPIRVRLLWFLYMPILTPLFGYFPGKTVRAVGDLPRGVTWQWRRWCLQHDYLLTEREAWRAAYAKFNAPILSISFEDDDLNTRNGIDYLHSSYTGSDVVRRHIQPREVGRQRIGHFGFFNEKCREPLWLETLEWLRGQASPSSESTTLVRPTYA